MRSTTPLTRIAADDYKVCIAHARTDEETRSLTDREPDVLALYALYAAGNRRPHQIASSRGWADASWQQEVWRLTAEGRPLAELYGKVLSAAGDFCLLCNAQRPGEVDHFLPRDQHPALSALHLNLVGVCDKCNKHKSTSCSLEPTKQFVHPYFDQIPTDVTFLHGSPLDGGVLTPVFHVAPPDAWPDQLGARLAWQFKRLHLDKYYGDAAITFFKGQSYGWLLAARGGWEPLAESLMGALASEVFAFGLNTWKAATLTCL